MDADQTFLAVFLCVIVIIGALFSFWITWLIVKWLCIAIARAIRNDKEARK